MNDERRTYEREGHGTFVVTDDLRAARAIGTFLVRASATARETHPQQHGYTFYGVPLEPSDPRTTFEKAEWRLARAPSRCAGCAAPWRHEDEGGRWCSDCFVPRLQAKIAECENGAS